MKETKKDLGVVLINPGNRKKTYASLRSLAPTLVAIEPPVWVGLIANYLIKKGLNVAILDANAEDLTPEETAKKVAAMNPLLTTVVVYGHNSSSTTQTMPAAGEICTAMKNQFPEMKVLMLGGHPSALPQRTLEEEATDFVCEGEGPITILELLKVMKAGQKDFSQVRGLWYKDGGQIKSNPPAPLITNLDEEMPGMPWELLPMDKYRAHDWHCFGHLQERHPYACLYTTLGCPFNCSFCNIQAPFRSGERASNYPAKSYRAWSPESVVAWIDHLVNKYQVKNIKFADELFVMNPRRLNEICDALIERNYDLNIWVYARIDTVRPEMVDKLKKAGFNWLAFGIEAGSDRVRNDINKRFTHKKVLETIKMVKDGGINIGGNYIFGLPEDDYDSMQETLDLALELNTEFANFYCAMALPGSPLYDQALRENWALPEKWSGYSQFSPDTLPLATKYLSGAEVVKFRDQAWQTYFTHPNYIELLRRKFGEETVDHIKQIAAIELDRNS